MAGSGYFRGAAILAAAGFISKLLGALYRIPLARLLGGEGMGLYQMAYPIYTVVLSLSTAGIPVAISILVAERLALGDVGGAKRIFRVALFLMAGTGAVFSFLVMNNAHFLAERVLREPRAYYAIAAISPAIFFASVVSVLRGYFQGFQQMKPTALSQLVEQLVRVATVLFLSWWLLPAGIEWSAAGAAFGAVTGGLAALLVLALIYKRFRSSTRMLRKGAASPSGSTLSLMGRMLVIALPLSLGGMVMSLMQAADAVIVPLRLQLAGYSAARSVELFGQLTGMAGTLLNLPAIVTMSIATSLIPAVSKAASLRKLGMVRSHLRTSLRATLLFVLPAACGLWILASPIGLLLYDLEEVGQPLSVLAPGVIFLGLYQVSSGSLQGLGKPYIPAGNFLAGVMLKIFLTYKLAALPSLGVQGAALATVAGFALAFFLNYRSLVKLTGLSLPWQRNLLKPGAAALFMSVVVYWFYHQSLVYMSSNRATLAAVFIGILVYGFALVFLGAVQETDLRYVPKAGPWLARFLKKMHLLK
ncbi:MAG: polysaccharide biosynthesis protein [Clostridia bacterium]|nr:polysaccharide biosynthesis protein [Clostridia bacterium]